MTRNNLELIARHNLATTVEGSEDSSSHFLWAGLVNDLQNHCSRKGVNLAPSTKSALFRGGHDATMTRLDLESTNALCTKLRCTDNTKFASYTPSDRPPFFLVTASDGSCVDMADLSSKTQTGLRGLTCD
jgi:hypothetical protein